ncbi:unnamed protein product [Closterium sp. NIES-53]
MTASAPKDPNRFLTSFHAALVACSSEAAAYGRCVAARVPGVDKAVCEKEFLQLKTCFYASLRKRKSPGMSPAQSPAMSPRKGSRTPRERRGGWGSQPASPAPSSGTPTSAASSPSRSGQASPLFASSVSPQDESSPVVLGPRPLLRFDVPGAAGVMYDEPHGILLVSAHEKVYTWRVPTPAQEQQSLEQYIQQQQQLNHSNSHAHAHTPGHSRTHSLSHSHLQPVQQPAPQVFAISDRPVLAVRFSLDGRILAVQRSAHELELLLRRPSSSSTATTAASSSPSSTPTAAAAASSSGSGAAASGRAEEAAPGQGGDRAGDGGSASQEEAPETRGGRSSASGSSVGPSSGSGGATSASAGASASASAGGGGSGSGRSRSSLAAEAALNAPVTVTAPALTYRSRSAADKILGFFWSDCPLCDLVIVTTGGLELFRVAAAAPSGGAGAPASPPAAAAGAAAAAAAAAAGAAGAGGSGSGQVVMRMVEAWRVAIGWYVYTHESRVLILAAGPRFCSLTAIQFSAAGLVKLPKFTAQLGTSAAPTTTSTHSLTAKPAPPVVLAPQDVRIANMYGRIYCVQVDRVSSLLHIFRFFRDAIVLQVSIPLPSTRVAVSVADNLLLVHLPAIHRLLLFDPLLNHWKPICPALAPAFAPLPSTLLPSLPPSFPRALSRTSTNASSSGDGSSAPSTPQTGASSNSSSSGGGSSRSGSSSSSGGSGRSRSRSKVYGSGWVLVNPDLVLDHVKGMLWRLHLNLQSLAVCAADRSSLFPLLQRRRCNRQQVHAICLSLFSDLLTQRSPLPTLSSAFSSLLSAYATALAAAARKPKPVQDTPAAARNDASSGRSSSSTVAAKQQAGEGESAEQQQVGANNRTASGGFFHVAAESGAVSETAVSETAVSGADGGLGEALEGKGGAGGGGGVGGEVGGREPATLSRTSSVASVGEGSGVSASRGGGAGGGGGGEAEAADPAVEEDEGVVSPEHLLHQIDLHLEACMQQSSRHRSTSGAGESSRGETREDGEAGGDGGGGGREKGEEERGGDGGCGEKERDGGAAERGAAWHDSSYTVGVLVELIRCMDDLRLPLPAFLRAQLSLVRLLASHHLWAALLHLLSAKLLRFSPAFAWDLLHLSSSPSPLSASASPSLLILPAASLKARARVRREAVRLLQVWLVARDAQEQGRVAAQRREDMAALLRGMVLCCGPLAAARFLASTPPQVFWQHAPSLLACLSHPRHLHLAPAVLRCFQEAVPSFQEALASRAGVKD